MTLDEKFQQFHRNNPLVYTILLRLTREAIARGKTKGSIKMFYEVARWEHYISIAGDDTFKLNNNYHSRYARLLNDAIGYEFFETRVLKGAI